MEDETKNRREVVQPAESIFMNSKVFWLALVKLGQNE
jgi:hypothetical protein